MDYKQRKFSVGGPGSEQYAKEYERIFGKPKRKARKRKRKGRQR